MLESIHTRGVSLGHRKFQPIITNEEVLEEKLELGRNFRKSNSYPIYCRMKLNTVYDDGESSHWIDYNAIIPPDGINEEGYVKEIWVEILDDGRIELDGKSYKVINPYVHVPDQRILEIMLNKPNYPMTLLPSPEIVVKYFDNRT